MRLFIESNQLDVLQLNLSQISPHERDEHKITPTPLQSNHFTQKE